MPGHSTISNIKLQKLMARSRYDDFVEAMSLIQKGETWTESFQRHKANTPSEIIPGLYLGNIKTAAAYIMGVVDSDDSFPKISRIVTVISKNHHLIGIERFPEPQGSGKNIQRFMISKYDNNNTNLLENFDESSAFIHQGVLHHGSITEPQTHNKHETTFLAQGTGEAAPANSKGSSTSLLPPGFGSSASRFIRRTQSEGEVNTINTLDLASLSISQPTTQKTSDTTSTLTSSISSTLSTDSPKGGVLVHCHAGISRSTTIVIAYLLKYHRHLFALPTILSREGPAKTPRIDRMLIDRAVEFVLRKRPIVNPNLNFRLQLSVYVHKLDCSITGPKTGELKEEYKEFLELFNNSAYGHHLRNPDKKMKALMMQEVSEAEDSDGEEVDEL